MGDVVECLMLKLIDSGRRYTQRPSDSAEGGVVDFGFQERYELGRRYCAQECEADCGQYCRRCKRGGA